MARVYAVTNKEKEELTLVKANSQAQALWHVAKNDYECTIASSVDIVDYMQQGGEVEDAIPAKPATDEE